MQLAKGLVYLTTITDLFIWFQVTYPSPVKSQKFDVFSIRTSSSAQKVSSSLFWKAGALFFYNTVAHVADTINFCDSFSTTHHS